MARGMKKRAKKTNGKMMAGANKMAMMAKAKKAGKQVSKQPKRIAKKTRAYRQFS